MHPQLTSLHALFQAEEQPFRKVHRMIDLFESIIKMHTVVIMAEYVRHNRISDTAKGMLAAGLRTPSLGTWQLFSRELYKELQQQGMEWSLPSFAGEFEALDKALNNEKTNVVAFRNGYAHGATPSDAQCTADIRRFEPFLDQLLASEWLRTSALEVREGRVVLVGPGGERSLHPILLHRPEAGDCSIAFFNDLKNDKVGLLNYPLGKHYREKELWHDFHQHLPLHEWKRTGSTEFLQRIEELTETFKGRTLERERLLRFAAGSTSGYLSIQGNPGIGKSALIAQFFKDLRAHEELKGLQVVEYFIRRGTPQARVEYMLEYLIRRTDELFPKGREIRAEGRMTFDLQAQLFSKWRLWGTEGPGRLLFLIDGIDEGVENDLATYLPRELFQHILFIYGSRPGGHASLDRLWGELPVEHHTRLELSGLGREDIRALIYEVANKYELERESAWIEAVQLRSQGNPLYLKLLCDALANGGVPLNDIAALPAGVDDLYRAILLRYANDARDGDALLAALYTFAAAHDYLTLGLLGRINALGEATLQRIGSILKEVLYENPLTEQVLDYQLFHESFRDYLRREKPLEVADAAERIMDFCAGWRALEGSWEQRYALEHWAAHLAESNKEKRTATLLELVYDTAYAAAQKQVLKGFDASRRLYRYALQQASVLQRHNEQLEAALCLVDLKYEEGNDAPQIMALVANGEMELVLKRIESFGGDDKQGLQRKFTLYMLCLMELTLLDSSTAPHRKAGCAMLLQHLDEHLPTDHSILNWNDFFPSYLVFRMACEWAEMGLDHMVVYKRTDDWDTDWIAVKAPYSALQIQVLLAGARGISKWVGTLTRIAVQLAKQGRLEEALDIARGIIDDYWKIQALNHIAIETSKQGQMESSATVMREAVACARGITDDFRKSSALISITVEQTKQGQQESFARMIQEAIDCARGLVDDRKSRALKNIACALFKQGLFESAASLLQEALACASGLSEGRGKDDALEQVACEFAKQGQLEEGLAIARGINYVMTRSSAVKGIAVELVKQGRVEEAVANARGIIDHYWKSQALNHIAGELGRQDQLESSASLLQEAFVYAKTLGDARQSSALKDIALELSKQGHVEEALSIARGISSDIQKSSALKGIAVGIAAQGQVELCAMVMQEARACALGMIDARKSKALNDIASEMAKLDQVEESSSVMQESLAIARGISHEREKSRALNAIAVELAKQGQVDEALASARGISDDYWKSNALADISTELAKQGKLDGAAAVMQEALAISRGIRDGQRKSRALTAILVELSKQGQVQSAEPLLHEALACARGITDESYQISALKDISTELAKQGKVDDAASALQEALTCARGIRSDSAKSSALKAISTELAKQGKVEEALNCARSISSDFWKSRALAAIAGEISSQGQVDYSATVMDEAIICARSISTDFWKSSALAAIVVERSKQGYLEESLSIARALVDEGKRIALKAIAIEMTKQDNWSFAQQVGLEIPQTAARHACWEAMAAALMEREGLGPALRGVDHLGHAEAVSYYMKGWAEALPVVEATPACLREALSRLAGDADALEDLLQRYALHEAVFGRPAPAMLQRLNRTLNIQWLLDITAQFPRPSGPTRLSTNLDSWLHTIADEDDRAEVELLARKVAKGKLTEAEFAARVAVLG
jgi:hypothetical protein